RPPALDRIAMKLVSLPANGEGDLLPDPRCDRFLDSSRIGNVTDHGTLGILFKQFCQESGPVSWRAGPTAISQVTQHYRPFLGGEGLSHGVFDGNHVGMKGMPLGPTGFFDLFGNLPRQVWLFVGRDRDTDTCFKPVRGEEPAQQ